MFEPSEMGGSSESAGIGADVTIVLAGAAPEGTSFVEPLFGDLRGEHGMVAALLCGRAPVITIQGGQESGDVVELAAGRPAINDAFVLARSLNTVLPRLVTLLVQAVERVGQRSTPLAFRSDDLVAIPERSTHALVARGIHDRLQRWRKPARRRSRWQVAYRLTNGTATADLKAWPQAAFATVPNDKHRFYADPFAFRHEGRSHIFFEDFPFATREGVISRVEVDGQGVASAPTTVLARPFHLSYPLVLRHEGSIYMLPEMGATRRLQLFRADPFPDHWREDRVLLDGVGVADATPVFYQGRWWMFAALLDEGGSAWDALGLFHAPDLLGPWIPHKGNPVLIDAGSTRPAGALWFEDGHLMRVAQDCRDGYGMGIVICRVERLDLDGFAQTVVASLGAPRETGARAAHTLNRDGDLEVVDLNYTFVG